MKWPKTAWILVLLILITLLAWKIRYYQISRAVVSSKVYIRDIPVNIFGWNGRESNFSEGTLSNLGVDEYIMRRYDREGEIVIWLYVGYYRSQKQGGTAHSPLHCYPGGGWDPVDSNEEEIQIPSLGRTIRVKRFIVGKGDEREVVYYWYQERGRVIASEYVSKFYQVFDSFIQGRNDGALVRFSTRSGRDTNPAKSVMKEFIRHMFPYIEKSMPR